MSTVKYTDREVKEGQVCGSLAYLCWVLKVSLDCRFCKTSMKENCLECPIFRYLIELPTGAKVGKSFTCRISKLNFKVLYCFNENEKESGSFSVRAPLSRLDSVS